MKAVCLHAKDEIEAFLRRNTWLHLYLIGDLDDFFWQYTTWYAAKDALGIKELALLYAGTGLPVLLAMPSDSPHLMRELLRSILYLLPRRFYGHLNEEVVTALADDYSIQSHGLHYKMALMDSAHLDCVDTPGVIPLSIADAGEIEALYHVSYPGNWFDPRMLETGCYYGIRQATELISVAGVHVYSQHYKIAALGNVTTHPDFRGQGLGTAVCARLCQELLRTVAHIGLNVKADNSSAIACYKRLGFECIATYEEYTCELKQ